VCPARSKEVVKHKAIDMAPKEEHLERERANFDFFLGIPPFDRRGVKVGTIKGSQTLEPLFEFSGACAGCGETPYLKLLSQMYGDRIMVANATGCSSIYGGNLPTTPWSVDANGRGPAWANSLFEDNAEFGLGMRLALDQQRSAARAAMEALAPAIGEDLSRAILDATQEDEGALSEQRERVAEMKEILAGRDGDVEQNLLAIADALVRKSVWIVGGDGWAYDIGFGGLDHVLATGRDVNVLVLDTQVYSNTGGQASKATPRGAVAKFAAGGKPIGRKDLGLFAAGYGNVYVGQVAVGADNAQTVKVFAEAETWGGPSLIIAYSTCIAHGIDMSTSMSHQSEAVKSGFWPLWRYDPRLAIDGKRPMRLDSKAATIPLEQFQAKEARFAMLERARPAAYAELHELAEEDAKERRHLYEQMAGVERRAPGHPDGHDAQDDEEG
jgi:pyruvate-ferredoxin/flavodoxin oxidoreductase